MSEYAWRYNHRNDRQASFRTLFFAPRGRDGNGCAAFFTRRAKSLRFEIGIS
jgi:hypothetical protein